jgi:hypothetical protein
MVDAGALTDCETACARLIAMERPSKRAQFVHGMRAYSAHNRLHVNARDCAILHNRRQLRGRITLATNREDENGSGAPRETHNRLHVNAPAPR